MTNMTNPTNPTPRVDIISTLYAGSRGRTILNLPMNAIFPYAMRGAPALIISSCIFPLVASRAGPASLWDYDVSETFNNVDTSSDFYTLDSEPTLESPDQVNQGISGLVSDPNMNLWAEVSNECFLDSQSTNDIQKRNDACSNSGSLNQPGKGSSADQPIIPGLLLETGMKATQTPTSDDTDICSTLDIFDARYFAVCDSGRDNDRIVNRITGEYALIDCERRKLQEPSNESTLLACSCRADYPDT